MSQALLQAARIIKSGGLVIYPTETLYALGCLCGNEEAVTRLFQAKNRDVAKSLPVIVGSWEQFAASTRFDKAINTVVSAFWPGPLSVLVRLKGKVPSQVMDSQGRTSLRFTPHPVAGKLCLRVASPLVATSANLSGKPGPATLENLDPELRPRVDYVLESHPFPRGGDPSTLIEVLTATRVRILRPGAISVARFAACGIEVDEMDAAGA
jgi:L-threonylcarbamoyladenylate synthase